MTQQEYVPRPIFAELSSDGKSYAVALADGTTRNVPAAIFEALFVPYTPPPIMDDAKQPSATPVISSS